MADDAKAGVERLDELGPELVEGLDAHGMLAMIESLPEQLEEGWELAFREFSRAGLAEAGRPDGVVVCGMGGSAIGADMVGACLPSLPVPYQVVRGYELPAWVSPRTLVVAVSYSGETEETLACVESALRRGCRPVCIAAGGRLAALAGERGQPLVMPPAGLQPRAALGHLLTAVAATLECAGLAGEFALQVEDGAHQARNVLTAAYADVPEGPNRAKAIARRLHGRLPLIYGCGVTAPAARRWKGQINENAKAPAWFNELPELDHNELAGWEAGADIGAQVALVLLEDPQGDARLARRAELTAELLASRVAVVERVLARGGTPLGRLLSVAYLGDFVSFYLALLHGVDPSPVAAIESLKQRLAADADAGDAGAR